jgi:ElaB/YqjD/DUF883 family membrane-anchored ribosome-binding protein
VTGARDPEQIQSEIAQTREELGDTIEALAQKADVKAQARERIEETKASVSEKKDEFVAKAREVSPEAAANVASEVSQTARERPVPLGVAFAAGFLLGRVSKRRRR